jgi:hypothetical protein
MRVQLDYVSKTFLLWVEVRVRSGSGPENYPEPDPNRTGPQRGSRFGMIARTGPGSGSGFGENGFRTGPHRTAASLALAIIELVHRPRHRWDAHLTCLEQHAAASIFGSARGVPIVEASRTVSPFA